MTLHTPINCVYQFVMKLIMLKCSGVVGEGLVVWVVWWGWWGGDGGVGGGGVGVMGWVVGWW